MMHPVIALLSDFGLRDHYVGTMKGVILGICPDATLVDITHDIPAQDVVAGALELAACYRYFPAQTVFLAVVDPGVGSSRRAIAAEAGGYRFVAPDNGLLAPVFDQVAPAALVELSEPRLASASVSHTFEGRDRFAPAAAWLARGTRLEEFGAVLADYLRLALPTPTVSPGGLDGEVLRVDRFGNLVTNIEGRMLSGLAGEKLLRLDVEAGQEVVGPVVSTYSEARAGALCALVGSTGHLEVAVNGGSAAERLRLGRGAKVSVRYRR